MSFQTIDPFELDKNFFHGIGRQWMLVTAAKPDGSVNSMTAAWGGIGFIWQQPVAFVFIRPQRRTKTFVEASTTLSLSFLESNHRDALNFMGSISGYDDADKVAHSGLTLAWCETEVLQAQPPGGASVEQTPYFSEASLVLIGERLYQQDMRRDCFLDQAQLPQWYGQYGDENDLHTLYIVGLRHVLTA